MSDFMAAIKSKAATKKKMKWQILKEYELEINEMQNSNFTLKEQVELILENNILEKLDLKEYRNILIKHFNYISNSKKTVTNFEQKKVTDKIKTQNTVRKTNPATLAKELLSQEISLV